MDTTTNAYSKQGQLFVWPRERHLVWRAVLAWGLVVSGDQALSQWEPLVLDALRARYVSNTRTAEKAVAEARRLLRYLQARGAIGWREVTAELVSEWCWAARLNRSGAHQRTSSATARNRQWAASAAFHEAAGLGAPIEPEVLIGTPISRSETATAATRPLTDSEAALVCEAVEAMLVRSRLGVITAMAFCGGSSSEIAGLRVGDVDIAARTVEFRGERARVNRLDDWAVLMMTRFVANQRSFGMENDDLLCVTGDVEAAAAAHSVTVRLGEVLQTAGLKGRRGVSARSIRLNTARKILARDGIEAAARLLGAVSLDSTAAALAHHWRNVDG